MFQSPVSWRKRADTRRVRYERAGAISSATPLHRHRHSALDGVRLSASISVIFRTQERCGEHHRVLGFFGQPPINGLVRWASAKGFTYWG